MKKHFKINSESIFRISEMSLDELHLKNVLISNHQELDKNAFNVIITPSVKEQIFNHIGWGQETKDNQVEQGGFIVGKVIQDSLKKIIYGMALKAIPAFTADGSLKHLKFDHNTWQAVLNELDYIIDEESKDNLQLVGWYHTHPKHLEVYMSETDKKKQALLFYQNWHFALIFNPQKKIWRAFHGANSKECIGYIINRPMLWESLK